ncbi:MAG: hypothetical protein JNK19_14415 [Tabrizicola sp.]|nr:hypothetical protein [Tabrizicola sp.]
MRIGLAGSFAILAALLPMHAVALECRDYSIQEAYWYYKSQPESYILVRGAFTDVRRKGGSGAQPLLAARFIGHKASRRAFDQPFETEVILHLPDNSLNILVDENGNLLSDYDPIKRAQELLGVTGLIWFEQTAEGYKAEEGLCWPLIDSDPLSVKQALRCLNGRYCPEE